MALLRVQAGTWVVCQKCGWIFWPFFEEGSWANSNQPVLSQATMKVLDVHMSAVHALVPYESNQYWKFFRDLQCWML